MDVLYSSIPDCTENNAITCANARACSGIVGECIVLWRSRLHREHCNHLCEYLNTRTCSGVAGECIVSQHSWLHREQYNHLCKYQRLQVQQVSALYSSIPDCIENNYWITCANTTCSDTAGSYIVLYISWRTYAIYTMKLLLVKLHGHTKHTIRSSPLIACIIDYTYICRHCQSDTARYKTVEQGKNLSVVTSSENPGPCVHHCCDESFHAYKLNEIGYIIKKT